MTIRSLAEEANNRYLDKQKSIKAENISFLKYLINNVTTGNAIESIEAAVTVDCSFVVVEAEGLLFALSQNKRLVEAYSFVDRTSFGGNDYEVVVLMQYGCGDYWIVIDNLTTLGYVLADYKQSVTPTDRSLEFPVVSVLRGAKPPDCNHEDYYRNGSEGGDD